MRLTETARAKVNLTLKVVGRRSDGYHALESLVSFASAGDSVSLELGAPVGVMTDGPFAGAIEGTNLLARTLALVAEACAELRLGAVRLTKMLPVAAGLGGGSADAAALLRLIARANPQIAPEVDWMALAARLGADVPVCLGNAPALMWGVGERLVPLPAATGQPGPLPAVLVNPRRPLATAAVFKALAASLAPEPLEVPAAPVLTTVADVAGLMRSAGNDLEPVAQRLLPVIGEVKRELAAQPGCLAAALSGSGPTCFALFATPGHAAAAAQRLGADARGWWAVATEIEFPAA
ncbi:MAG: 4-(cytidine 5'-diphospho)-2-C-methyl-D-erythritol kinase [Hyphomicrobiaceae bacterium]|nr:4-(cytidine 5'-diphospho)-2-C-methyl-D-erythritol kinase [Hyphomicrobiaceae bacterium]